MIVNPGEGKSPYQYAVEGGYTGTEEEFRAALAEGPWLPVSGGELDGPLGIYGTVDQNRLGVTIGAGIQRIMVPSGSSVPPSYINVVGTIVTGGLIFDRGLILSMNKISYLASPTSPYDAANKNYVDTAITGKMPYMGSVTIEPDKINLPPPEGEVAFYSPDVSVGVRLPSGASVMVLPDASDADVIKEHNIRCTGYDGKGSSPIGGCRLLFKGDTLPETSVKFNVIISSGT